MAGRAGHKHRRWRVTGKKAHLDHVRNDINVTPLVDVMLVLLIIFMLMTLIMGRGYDVKLFKARHPSVEKDKLQPVVSVDINGTLYVEKSKLGPVSPATLKEMHQQVQAAWDAPKNPEGVGRIYLKADNGVEYGTVYPVLVYFNREMGVSAVDLAVSRAEEGGGQ